jgi:CheY-specific phosphatase CheX
MTAQATPCHAFRVEYIQPFLDSLRLLFETHLGYNLTIQKPKINQTGRTSYDMSGVIAFSGTAHGRAVISLPSEVAYRLACDFSHMEKLPEGILEDCIAELANVIVGKAKSSLKNHNIIISAPTVVRGKDYTITPQRGAACLTIPCECKHGEFQLDISIVGGMAN